MGVVGVLYQLCLLDRGSPNECLLMMKVSNLIGAGLVWITTGALILDFSETTNLLGVAFMVLGVIVTCAAHEIHRSDIYK